MWPNSFEEILVARKVALSVPQNGLQAVSTAMCNLSFPLSTLIAISTSIYLLLILHLFIVVTCLPGTGQLSSKS